MPISEIQEVLFALAGYDNQWHSADKSQSEVGLPRNAENTLGASRVLLNDLLLTGSTYRTLSTTQKKLCESPSQLVSVVCAQVKKHLREYKQFIGALEERVIERDTALTKGQDEVSLTVLRSVVQPHARVLYHLRDITTLLQAVVDEGDRTNPATLLSALRLRTLTGYPKMKQVSHSFLLIAEKVYIEQIRAWCLYGTLLSEFPGDFFVQQCLDQPGHALHLQLCPDYIFPETALNIFTIGNIRARLHEHVPMYSTGSYESRYLHEHEAILSRISLPINADHLQNTILDLQKSFSANVLTKALPKSIFSSLLALLRKYCMLDDGYFALQLVSIVQEEFRSLRARDMGQLTDDTVHAIFAKTLAKNSTLRTNSETLDVEPEEQHTIDLSILSLSLARVVPSAETPADRVAFNDLLFGIPIDMNVCLTWPMDVLLLKEDIAIYTELFHYLMALRRAQQLLQGLWRGRRDEIKHPKTSKATWTTAFRVLYFLESLSEYYHANVIDQFQRCIYSMLASENEVYDPIALAAKHRHELLDLRNRIIYKDQISMASLRKLLLSVDMILHALRDGRSEALSKHSIDMLECIDTFKEQISLEPGTEGLLLKLQLGT